MISQIQKAVKTAFDQAGDMASVVTLKRQDPMPDNPPPGYEVEYTNYSVRVIKQDYTTTEMAMSGGAITSGDRKILMPASQIDFRPIAGQDYLIINGKQSSIKSVRIKANSLYILRI